MIRQHVYEGMTCWAAYGQSGWSAIRVLKIARKNVQCERVKARTGEVVTRNAKAPINRLVPRDPKKKGKDRPPLPPSDYFKDEEPPKPKKSAEEAAAVLSPKDQALLGLKPKPAPPKPAPGPLKIQLKTGGAPRAPSWPLDRQEPEEDGHDHEAPPYEPQVRHYVRVWPEKMEGYVIDVNETHVTVDIDGNKKRVDKNEVELVSRVHHLLELLDDDSTIDDW